MSEKHFGPNWELLKAKLENVRLTARFSVEGTIQEAKYRTLVSPEKHKRASMMAEAFAGEAMDFLRENPSGKLKPVQPTREQLGIFYFLLDSIDNGLLTLEKTEDRVQKDINRPYLVKLYRAGQSLAEGGDLVSQVADLFSRKEVTLVVRGRKPGISFRLQFLWKCWFNFS